jgi:hypothetical protein
MCYNCGCGEPDKDHGNPKNITEKTFKESAEAGGGTAEDAKRNTLNLLKKKLESGKAA